MDTVIKQISDIESAAAAVMDSANARKKAFAEEMAERTAAFDREVDAETEAKVKKLQAEMEVEMNSKLAQQKENAEHVLAWMEKVYSEHHTEYVSQLFQSMIKE